MKSDFKRDWDECLDLHEQWWRRADSGRPLIVECKFKEAWQPPAQPPADPVKYWTDTDAALARAENMMAHRIYEGGAFPYYTPQLGPGSLGIFIGARPVFKENTIWYDPCFQDIREARAVLDRSNPWLKWTLAATRTALQKSKDRYLVAFPDLVEGLDTASALVGAEPILYALADAPAEAHRLMREINQCWFEAFDLIYELVKGQIGGNAFMAFDIVGRGKTAKLQCDISAMLSPDMFNEFVAPYLSEQADWLDYALYHLDGPSALQHLDTLCAIESLDAVQWMPGAGVPWGQDPCWDHVYRKILDSGKGVMAYMPERYVEGFTKKFGTRGVYITLSG